MMLRTFRCFLLGGLVALLSACGILESQYVPYAGDGASAACPNSLNAYAQNLAAVFTAENCGCHSFITPTITGDNNLDSTAFLQAARTRGSPEKLIEYLIGGRHPGASDAQNQAAALNSWAAACAGG